MKTKNNPWQVSLSSPYLELIQSGKKTAEGRIYKNKFKEMCIGDYILFIDNHNTNKTVLCVITYLHVYKTFHEMLTKEGLNVMLPCMAKTIEAGVTIYKSFPGFAEQELLHGVVALGIKVC